MDMIYHLTLTMLYMYLSYDDASGREIMPCDKIDHSLEVYRFWGNVMLIAVKIIA